MRINTESNTYKTARRIAGDLAYLGGCVSLDCVAIPFIQAVFDTKFRFMRPIGYFGTWALSMVSGALAENVVEEVIDSTVELINDHPSEDSAEGYDNKYDEPQYDVSAVANHENKKDILNKDASPKEEESFVNDRIAEVKPFEFSDEESAKAFVEWAQTTISENGFATVAVPYFMRVPRPVDKHVFDILVKYGWDKPEEIRGIDRINDNLYVVDAFGYHDISNHYEILDMEE